MIDVIPAVLPHNWSELEEGLRRVRSLAPLVQIDVVKDIFAGREFLPMWEELDFELDLYIDPEEFAARAVGLGASRVVVHERQQKARRALEVLKPLRGCDYPTAVGLALRPSDLPAALDSYAGLFDYVQVMGIDKEGEQGQEFDPRAIELVRSLRAAHPALFIQVDGHAAGHEGELARAGASRLVVGSAIVRADNPEAAFKEIYTRANGS